jgi:hypothetical protein
MVEAAEDQEDEDSAEVVEAVPTLNRWQFNILLFTQWRHA